MATVYQFQRSDDTLQVVHEGSRLITGVGEDAVVQTFADRAAARAHLDHVVSRRRREGYAVTTSEVTLESGTFELAELAEFAQWDVGRRRMTVTFRGAAAARELCAPLVEIAASLRPRCLHVLCDPGSPGAAFPAALADEPLPSVQRFVFDTHFQTLTRQRSNTIGDLTDVFAAMPALEAAFISGEVVLRPCTHPRLRELCLLGDPLLPSAVSALGQSSFPELERLGLALCHETAPGPDLQAARALPKIDAPRLTAVEVEGLADVAAFLATLTERPWPARWSRLWLAGVVDEDALMQILEQRAAVLRGLTALALPLGDGLSADNEARARRWIPGIVDCEALDDPFLPAAYAAW